MSPQRTRHLQDLLDQALQKRGAERSTFLDLACADDPSLRFEVDELLKALMDAPKVLAESQWETLRQRQAEDGSATSSLDGTKLEAKASRADPDRPMLERLIGSYTVHGVLGRGGMGVVYRAKQQDPPRQVALKMMNRVRDPERSVRRFRNEIEILGYLQHPGIAQIFDAGMTNQGDDSQLFFAMEYVDGLKLNQYADERGLTVKQRLGLMGKVCDAVQYAHQKGFIHRDLKPGNILVNELGQPKILDFGLARATRSDLHVTPNHTEFGELVGTIRYMSPEQCKADPNLLDTRSDVYSLGVILYELLCHRLPYDLDPRFLLEAIWTIETAAPRPLTAVDRSLREDLETIVAKALEKRKEHRFQSAGELAFDLRRVLNHEPILARPASRIHRLRRVVQRHRILSGGIFSAFLLLVMGLWVAIHFGKEAIALRDVVDEQRNLATQSLADRELMADVKRLRDLKYESQNVLWPALPEYTQRIEEWLRRARTLKLSLPICREALSRLREKARMDDEARVHGTPGRVPQSGEWKFIDDADQWVHDALSNLVRELEVFTDSDSDVHQTNIAGVVKRLDDYRALRRRLVEEHGPQWDHAIASIEDREASPRYEGLKIAPQIGLVPIGRDPQSGLSEFVDIRTGAIPERNPDGKLQLDEKTGLVFVLIPAGTFNMGAVSLPAKSPNFDPEARPDEKPVHEVSLDAFFLSKYEMTQGQWERIAGTNPSEFRSLKGFSSPWTALHPVETVSWEDCHRIALHQGWTIPTEAQWEYAARAGTSWVRWTGDSEETLQGAANIFDRSRGQAERSQGHPEAHAGMDFEDWLNDGSILHAQVGTYRANSFGLHDVLGNVAEWCRESLGDYSVPPNPGDGERPVLENRRRVFRGGGHRDFARGTRSAYRPAFSKSYRHNTLGFRPARCIRQALGGHEKP